MVQLDFLSADNRNEVFSDSRIVRNSIDGNAEAAPSGRRACAGACAFFVVGVACTEQVL